MKLTASCILSGLALTSCYHTKQKQEDSRKPNFIIVVADDLGFTDITPFGGNTPTPVIESLAREGIRFSNFHVQPTSSPTRSSLLTGCDNHIAGLGIMSEMDYPVLHEKQLPGYAGHLSRNVVTIPELLREKGYHTYMAGKWHLGEEEGMDPHDRGFEETFILGTGGGSHWNDKRPLAPPQKMVYTRNGKIVELPGDFYSSRNYTDSIISFIDRNKNDKKPFFAYVSYTAVHDPLHVPEDYIKKYRGKFDMGWDSLRLLRAENLVRAGIISPDYKMFQPGILPSWKNIPAKEKEHLIRDMEVYAGMVEYLDMSIGRLISYLKNQGLYDNTMIVFMSDNGANGAMATAYPGNADGKYLSGFDNSMNNRGLKNSYIETGPGWAQACSGPYRMFKSFTTEGGIRTPLIITMPGLVKNQGNLNKEFVHVTDIMPTILELAQMDFPEKFNGNDLHPMTGKSIVPVLRGDSVTVHSADGMGWELFEMRAYIQGKWKILRLPSPYGSGNWQLFDLETDPGETTDLSDKFPLIRESLVKRWQDYAKNNGVFDHNGHYDSLYRSSFRPENEDD